MRYNKIFKLKISLISKQNIIQAQENKSFRNSGQSVEDDQAPVE